MLTIVISSDVILFGKLASPFLYGEILLIGEPNFCVHTLLTNFLVSPKMFRKQFLKTDFEFPFLGAK